VTRRLFGPGVDEPIAREDASGNEGWYETDELGNVRGITSGTGTPLTTITYDGWGNVLSNSTSAQSDRYLKAGSQWDSALQQWVNGARVENGDGRWDQEDPTEFEPGDPNLYRYAGNDSTNRVDPSGLSTLKIDVSSWFASLMHEQVDKDFRPKHVRVKSYKDVGKFIEGLAVGAFALPGNLLTYLTLSYLRDHFTEAVVHAAETNGKFDGTLKVTTKGQTTHSLDFTPFGDILPKGINLGAGFKFAVAKYTVSIQAVKDELTDDSTKFAFTVSLTLVVEHGAVKVTTTDHFQYVLKPGEHKVIYWDESREFQRTSGDAKTTR
jgi:RHS repeat-associated protein